MTCSLKPMAAPFGSGPVTLVAPVATGTVLLQRVEPSADNVPRRTRVPGPAAVRQHEGGRVGLERLAEEPC